MLQEEKMLIEAKMEAQVEKLVKLLCCILNFIL